MGKRDVISNVFRGKKDKWAAIPARRSDRETPHMTTNSNGGGQLIAKLPNHGQHRPHHASLLSLRCVSAAGIIAKGCNGHVGYAGGPRGCSGAGAAPPSTGERGGEGGQTALLCLGRCPQTRAASHPPLRPPRDAQGLSGMPFRPLPGRNWLELRCCSGPLPPDPIWAFCAFRTHLFCAPPLPLCYVPAAGIITAGCAGCVGHTGGPHGCSGAGTAPPSTG